MDNGRHEFAKTAPYPSVGPSQLFKRQLRLLTLLYAFGSSVGRTDFQKMLFLYCQEHPSSDRAGTGLYEFIPYKFGAFSSTCDADLHRLRRHGLLCEGEPWKLTEEGRLIGSECQDSSVRAFVGRYARKRGNRLIKETYLRVPYCAIRSEKAEILIRDRPAALQRIRAAKPKAAGTPLLTVGYEGRMLEGYFNLLLRSHVTILCDVRRNPISRKYGFSKSTLAQICSKLAIRCEHLPELGVESKDRRGLETQGESRHLCRTYTKRILERQGDALTTILAWLCSGETVALTCYEHEPSQCHRHCIVAALKPPSVAHRIPNPFQPLFPGTYALCPAIKEHFHIAPQRRCQRDVSQASAVPVACTRPAGVADGAHSL